MRILGSVLAHARQIALDVPGIVGRFVEWRRQQHYQSSIVTHQICVQRLHRLTRTVRSTRSGYHAPALCNRVDLALVAGPRSEGRAVVEVGTTIPLTVPRCAL